MPCIIRDNGLYIYGSLVKRGSHNELFMSALNMCKAIYIDQVLELDVEVDTTDKMVSGGTIRGRLILNGTDYTKNKNVRFVNVLFDNAYISVRNYFDTSFLLSTFNYSTLELYNTSTWTERTTILDCGFHNSSIVFRTPASNYNSYMYTHIIGTWFRDSSIRVEEGANVSDSSIVMSNFWFNRDGQCGICVDGHMFRTLIDSVVFESFVENPQNLYGISLGRNSIAPYLGLLNFLGRFTARIYNPHGIWLYSPRSVRTATKIVKAGTETVLIDDYGSFGVVPLKISFACSGETTLTIKYILYDDTVIEKTYEFIDRLDVDPSDAHISSNIVSSIIAVSNTDCVATVLGI